MISTSCGNSWFVYRNNSPIGMSYEAVEARSVDSRGGRSCCINTTIDGRTVSGQMFSPGSSHSRLVSGHDSAIRMGHQLGIVEGTSVGRCISSSRSSCYPPGTGHSDWA